MSFNKQVMDDLDDLLVELGQTAIPRPMSWNLFVLEALAQSILATTGVDVRSSSPESWNSAFLRRIAGVAAAIRGAQSGGAEPKALLPSDFIMVDAMNIITSVTSNADGEWTITLGGAGADVGTAATGPVSTNLTTGAAFFALPLLEETEQLSHFDAKLELTNDPGVPSNLRVLVGVTSAINGTGTTFCAGRNFATGVADQQGSTTITTQARAFADSNVTVISEGFVQNGATVHYRSRPHSQHYGSTKAAVPTVMVPAAGANLVMSPSFAFVSLRPVGAVPAGTVVKLKVSIRKKLRPLSWVY